MKKILLSLSALGLMTFGSAFSQTVTTFNYTGAVQTFTVPAGVTEVVVDCIAASGGYSGLTSGTYTGHFPGDGGRVETTLTVTPGSTLNIYVGGEGFSPTAPAEGTGGFNGGGTSGVGFSAYSGGGGGGASDIRIGGTALTDRVIVAGGGGGAAYDYGSGDDGGDGGDLTGADGASGGGLNNHYGKGGTPTAGGGEGIYSGYLSGTPGVLGIGGDGGDDGSGGGGGGGYYGGGGGAWAGGGGGSSYADAGLCTGTVHTQGYNTGDGQVIITVLCNPLTVTVSDDTVCVGDEVTLDASGTGTITWDGGVSNGVPFTPPLGTTTYTATSSDGSDCAYEQTIFVGDIPSVDAGADVDACEGDEVTLSGSGATDYAWDGGITDGVPFTPAGGTTTYTVTGTVDSTGCQNTDMVDVNVTVIDLTVSFTGTEIVCNETGDSYQWIDCSDNSDIAGETDQSYAPTADGDYACEITLNGCVDTTACAGIHVGMEEFLSEHGINYYPVPADENLTITLKSGSVTFELLSMTGEILDHRIITEGTTTLDVSTYASGVYLISFTSEDEAYTNPLIIK